MGKPWSFPGQVVLLRWLIDQDFQWYVHFMCIPILFLMPIKSSHLGELPQFVGETFNCMRLS